MVLEILPFWMLYVCSRVLVHDSILWATEVVLHPLKKRNLKLNGWKGGFVVEIIISF